MKHMETVRGSVSRRIQKLLLTDGSIGIKPGKAEKQIIKMVTDSIVHDPSLSNKELTEQELRRIVKECKDRNRQRHMTQVREDPPPLPQQVPLIPQNNIADIVPVKANKKPATKESKRTGMLPNLKKCKPDQSDIWTDIMDLEQRQEREQREVAKIENDARRQKWRSELRMQKQQKEIMLQEVKKNDQSFYQKEMEDLQKWKTKESDKKKRKEAKLMEEQRLREMQLHLQRQQKQDEEQRLRDERDRIAQRLQEEESRDQEMERQRKEDEKRKMERLLQENKKVLEIKQNKKLSEQQYELKLNADYVRMEEAKERQREKKLKEMSDKIAAKMQAGSSAMKEQSNKDQHEEIRIARQQEQYNKRKEDEEFSRTERQRLAKLEMKKSLMTQVEQKERIKAMERQERFDTQLKFEREFELDQERNRAKQEKKLSKARENRKWLEKQIKLDALDATKADQSILEVQLNRTMLAKMDRQKVREHMVKSNQKCVTQIAKNYGGLIAPEIVGSRGADIASRTRDRGQQVDRERQEKDFGMLSLEGQGVSADAAPDSKHEKKLARRGMKRGQGGRLYTDSLNN